MQNKFKNMFDNYKQILSQGSVNLPIQNINFKTKGNNNDTTNLKLTVGINNMYIRKFKEFYNWFNYKLEDFLDFASKFARGTSTYTLPLLRLWLICNYLGADFSVSNPSTKDTIITSMINIMLWFSNEFTWRLMICPRSLFLLKPTNDDAMCRYTGFSYVMTIFYLMTVIYKK